MGKNLEVVCRVEFVDQAQFQEIELERMRRHDEWNAAHPNFSGDWPEDKRAIDFEAYRPGLMYEAPWYFDPAAKGSRKKIAHMRSLSDEEWNNGKTFLSRHYWRDWADKRPPLIVICPNGDTWCIDQRSSNGTGWVVTGSPPGVTCRPSIGAGIANDGKKFRYHGWLTDGAFCRDVDRPESPRGIRYDGLPA